MQRWPEIRRYARFDAPDEALLRELLPILRPHFPATVAEFYERIVENPAAFRVFTGGDAQIERQKCLLAGWLESTFQGPWDDAYFQKRSRIGRVHVWIGLEPRYMILGMHTIRDKLQDEVHRAFAGDAERARARVAAVSKICDVELAIMLETYGDEYAAQLKRRERLAALGQLGASISHEVKNPLGVIATSVYALKERLRGAVDERAARHIEKIERNVAQASEIVSSLLDFLRTNEPVRVERDFAALVRESAEAVQLPSGVTLAFEASPEAGRATVDPVQIARVVSNLVRNAAEAMAEGGPIAGGRPPQLPPVTVSVTGDAGSVEVRVRDRGPGVPADVLPQLFVPLFTTKPVGMGLGLALTKAIVEAHRGTIAAANRPDGGAEFTLRLPREGLAVDLRGPPR